MTVRLYYFRITGGDEQAGFDCTVSQRGGSRGEALRRATTIAHSVAGAIGIAEDTLQIADALPPPGTDELLKVSGVEP